MSGMWKRSHGRTSEAPPDERGGYRYVRPTATAPHLDSTHFAHSRGSWRTSLYRTHKSHSARQRDRRALVTPATVGAHATHGSPSSPGRQQVGLMKPRPHLLAEET